MDSNGIFLSVLLATMTSLVSVLIATSLIRTIEPQPLPLKSPNQRHQKARHKRHH